MSVNSRNSVNSAIMRNMEIMMKKIICNDIDIMNNNDYLSTMITVFGYFQMSF